MEMVREETLKRPNKVLLGILVASLAAISVALVIGILGFGLYSHFGVAPVGTCVPYTASNTQNSDDALRNNNAPALEYGHMFDKLVEQGTIRFETNICDEDVLPLHLTGEYVDNWYLNAYVRGGYEAWEIDEACNFITLYQKGNYYTLTLNWEEVGKTDEICTTLWTADINLAGYDIDLDSSFYPAVEGFNVDPCEGVIPGKEVKFYLCSDWTGCDSSDQSFTVMWEHRNIIPKN